MKQIPRTIALVLFLAIATQAAPPHIPKFSVKRSSCEDLVQAAREGHLTPFGYGLFLGLMQCSPQNNFCQELNNMLDNRCVQKLDASFYNPLRFGLFAAEVYAVAYYTEDKDVTVQKLCTAPVFEADSDDCTFFQKVADKLSLKLFDVGIVVTLFCSESNDFCKELRDLMSDVCINELDIKVYDPLALGMNTGLTYIMGLEHHSVKVQANSTLSSVLDASDRRCELLADIGDSFNIDQFSNALQLSTVCDRSNDFCSDLTHWLNDVCVDELPPKTYYPLAWGLLTGVTYMRLGAGDKTVARPQQDLHLQHLAFPNSTPNLTAVNGL